MTLQALNRAVYQLGIIIFKKTRGKAVRMRSRVGIVSNRGSTALESCYTHTWHEGDGGVPCIDFLSELRKMAKNAVEKAEKESRDLHAEAREGRTTSMVVVGPGGTGAIRWGPPSWLLCSLHQTLTPTQLFRVRDFVFNNTPCRRSKSTV